MKVVALTPLRMSLASDAADLIDDARDRVQRSVESLEKRRRERDDAADDDTDWTHIVTQKADEAPTRRPGAAKRSVFDDVDQ